MDDGRWMVDEVREHDEREPCSWVGVDLPGGRAVVGGTAAEVTTVVRFVHAGGSAVDVAALVARLRLRVVAAPGGS